jgi:hypothetical protein
METANLRQVVLQVAMENSTESAAMHAALRFVVVSDIPSEHKRVLIDVITRALRESEATEVRRKNAEAVELPWQAEDVTRLESLLENKIARSWQNADEILMGISGQLHRSPREVRSKATQLGLGRAVDYAIAKTQSVTPDKNNVWK